jgi:hypothetical protein
MSTNGMKAFSLGEDGLRHTGSDGRERYFPFTQTLRIIHSPWTGKLKLKGPEGAVSLSSLTEPEQKELLLGLFRGWKERQPESAKKAAFDYVDGQKGFVPLAFIACFFFSLPVAVGLLADAKDQFVCGAVLREGTALGTMDVIKVKKQRKGDYILDLEFTAPDGEKIRGHDQLITEDETKIPKQVPVVYSPARPSCWSLPPDLKGTQVNWAQKRYFGFFTLFFGGFFLVISLLGIAWSAGHWFRKRPFRKEIAQLFQL